ncbi:MAG: DNA-binding protein AraC-type [Paenibacillaceae bacterium]|jgi:AraC family transcriptional regulator|nr:DNA-binding protein AraC-type [Paenibacillaceae bacterium]
MEWVDRMNQAISYVEEHLCDEIDPGEISRIMACPYGIFQRFFIQCTDVPLSEYIRRRRLTCAAYEVQHSGAKIVDIAVKYGYDSSDAFSAAFKRMHGMAPAMARQPETKLKFYSRLHFTLSIRGVAEMNYRNVERESFKVIGRRRITPSGGGTWELCKQDGSLENLLAAGQGSPLLGVCFGFDDEGNNDYMVAAEYRQEDLPDFESFTFPPSSWLVFEASGAISSHALGSTWKRIYGEFLPQSDYRQSNLPTIETYHDWDQNADFCKVDIWIPLEK